MDADKKITQGIQKQMPNLVKLGIEEGADVNLKTINDTTPLKSAIYHHDIYLNKDSIEIVELLLKAGADINKEDPYYDTSLELAKRKGLDDVVELIKKYKLTKSNIK